MRPLRLEIEGFTCYRQRACVDFRDLDLFAITGSTGAGKTSLVDALAYALYGRIPRGGTEIKDFISQDAETLTVRLEFSVGEERYQVLRSTSRKATPGVVQLERWVADGAAENGDGRWLPEEGRARQANERIHGLVGLDYDAFTRSVLLPQGQFHQFLAGEPKERRKILSELLRLDVYDRVRERAAALQREALRDAERTAQLLRTQYAAATVDNLAQRRRELAELERHRAAAEADVRLLAGALEAARAAQAAEARRAEADERHRAAAQRLSGSRDAAQAAAEALARERPSLEAVEEAIARSPYNEELYAALRGAVVLARDVEKLEARLGELGSAVTGREQALAAAQKALTEAEAAHGEATGGLAQAESTLRDAQREHAASTLRAGLRPGDPCPVCHRPIEEVPAAGHPEVEQAEATLSRARQSERQAADRLAGSHRALDRAQQALDSARQERERAEGELASKRQDLLSLVGKETVASASETEAALRTQEQARSELQSLQEEKRRLETRLRALETERDRAEAAAAELERQAAELAEALARAEAEAAARRSELETVSPALDPPPSGLEEWVQRLNARHGEAQASLAELHRRLGSLQEAVERLEQDIEKAAQLREEESKRRQEALLAGELAGLLRADRFQAYMAHQALRLLAEDGSGHLRELSEGRFSLAADGDDFQVLDHWHADQARPVRTLSGGETFLASLALALALAERLPELAAGVPDGASPSALESLFIDEGFGTLSTDALDCVTAALDNLQRGQRMVGIVTHLRELADRLPAQITVRKTPQGSTIEQS